MTERDPTPTDGTTEDMIQREVRGEHPYDPAQDPHKKSVLERAGEKVEDALPGGNKHREEGTGAN